MKVEVPKQIDAPIERVFDVFTDLHHAVERIGGIESIEVLTDGPFTVGTRWKETRKMMGKLATETMWITAVDPPHGYTAEAESCGMHYTSMYTFEAIDGGTRVTMTFSGRPITLLAKLMSPMACLMAGTLRKMLAADIDDLAAVCESAPR